MTLTRGLLVRLDAKPGKEEELAAFLKSGRELAMAESGTVTWYAFRAGETSFGIFDTFESEEGRQAHLDGALAQALGDITPTLLARDPEMRTTDIVAAK